MRGDLNVALDQEKDTYNYRNANNPRPTKALLDMMNKHDLTDIYKELNPSKKQYTWRRKNPIKQARLDSFLVSTNLNDIVNKSNIKSSYR